MRFVFLRESVSVDIHVNRVASRSIASGLLTPLTSNPAGADWLAKSFKSNQCHDEDKNVTAWLSLTMLKIKINGFELR